MERKFVVGLDGVAVETRTAEWLDTDTDPGLCRYDGGKLSIDVVANNRGFVWAMCGRCGATGPVGKVV